MKQCWAACTAFHCQVGRLGMLDDIGGWPLRLQAATEWLYVLGQVNKPLCTLTASSHQLL